ARPSAPRQGWPGVHGVAGRSAPGHVLLRLAAPGAAPGERPAAGRPPGSPAAVGQPSGHLEAPGGVCRPYRPGKPWSALRPPAARGVGRVAGWLVGSEVTLLLPATARRVASQGSATCSRSDPVPVPSITIVRYQTVEAIEAPLRRA